MVKDHHEDKTGPSEQPFSETPQSPLGQTFRHAHNESMQQTASVDPTQNELSAISSNHSHEEASVKFQDN